MEFKAELSRRLVTECGFGAFFIESGIYDFLNIEKAVKAGKNVTDPMIAAAIGGLWSAREVDPLIPFLRSRVQGGTLALGGLDDQLGRGTYAQKDMPADLVEYLNGDSKMTCLAALQRHTLWQYDDKSPYGPADNAKIVGCLDSIESAIPKAQSRSQSIREADTAMVRSLRRTFARDFAKPEPGLDPATQSGNAREESMYLNFKWLVSRLPAGARVIVWTATVHAAKDVSGVPGMARSVSMGSRIRSDFTNEAFVLGFSAAGGSYGMVRQPVKPLIVAPRDALEARAFVGHDGDARFVTASEIRTFGPIAARPLGADFKTARWGDVVDGLVVFREEHPPTFAKH